MQVHGAQGKVDKAVLAYSGGLDTSVILKWLQEEYDCEVITFTADLGQVRIHYVGRQRKRCAAVQCSTAPSTAATSPAQHLGMAQCRHERCHRCEPPCRRPLHRNVVHTSAH